MRAVAGEQHPRILDRRAGERVVEVDEVRPGVAPQDVTGMAVAVQALSRAQVGHVEGASRRVSDGVGRRPPPRQRVRATQPWSIR